MKWGYKVGAGVETPVPFNLDVKTHCHALITGSSGSGKSYAVLYLMGCLLQDVPDIKAFVCDAKNSQDFKFLKNYPYYYGGDDCYKGVMEYYDSFCKARINGTNARRKILIFDEYPAFINYLSVKDKKEKTKKANEVLSAVSEILMLGRGISYGIWIVTQRPDASLFVGGSRENAMVTLALGRLSREMKGMLFGGEEIPDKIYHQGEGVILADGYSLQEIVYPRIRNSVDWKKHILQVLQQHCDQ